MATKLEKRVARMIAACIEEENIDGGSEDWLPEVEACNMETDQDGSVVTLNLCGDDGNPVRQFKIIVAEIPLTRTSKK